jgi:aconitate hydratase 2/2-methylisocitrate dehydratase
MTSNVTLLRWMIEQGYGDERTLERRARKMEEWLANPVLMEADGDAEYFETIEIDLDQIKEPLLACPNDPDDVKPLSEVAGDEIDEVFIGSCMTNIGHYRAAGRLIEKSGDYLNTVLWIAPPTRMDEHQLKEEGYYNIFGRVGARLEMPGCSLCMGNQARVRPGATVVSTSTRNFPNRLGQGANVYLASAELSAVAAVLGKLPTVEEYMSFAKDLDSMASELYRYLNFNEIEDFQKAADDTKVKFKNITVTVAA